MQRMIERAQGTTPRVSPVLSSRFESPPLYQLPAMGEVAPVESASPDPQRPVSIGAVPRPPRNHGIVVLHDQREIAPVDERTLGTPPLPQASAVEERRRSASPGAPDAPRTPDPFTHDTATELFGPLAAERRAPDLQRVAPPAAPPPPETVTVNLTIGHIELKSAPAPPPKPARPPAPARVSLDAYLKRRNGGPR